MSKENPSVEKVVPKSEKENLDKYSDILKNPINELESKKDTMKDALNKDEETESDSE